jgi:hypothetical protein
MWIRNQTSKIVWWPLQVLDLAAAFEGIEGERERLGIDEYSLSQTTLEQVFVAVAKQGTDPDAPHE